MRVLILEDDEDLRRLVTDDLDRQGFVTTSVATLAHALAEVRAADFDVALLDLALPRGPGDQLLAALCAGESSTHVIVMGGAGTEADRVALLDAGADDYVIKPFSARELGARVAAVNRHRRSTADRLVFGELVIDLGARIVEVAGSAVGLTAKEFDLLAFLAARPGHAFTRAELLRAVWDSSPEWQQERTVTEHIRRLRAKIEADPADPEILRTVRRVGYRFDRPAATVLRPAGAPAVVVHVDGVVVAADAAALDLVGAAEESSVVGHDLLGFVTEESLPAAETRSAIAASGGWPGPQRLHVRRADGGQVLVEVRSTAIVWEGRDGARHTLTRVAEPPPQLRQLVTSALGGVLDPVTVTDPEGFIVTWNEAAERLYGWSWDEVAGRQIDQVIPWVGSTDAEAMQRSLRETGRWFGHGEQEGRDGRPVRVAASTTVLRDEAGVVVGIVSVNRPAEPPATDGASRPRASGAALRKALQRVEFEPHFQPVVNLGDGRVTGVEALVRWNHPGGGVLSASTFLDDAERTGLIVDLGQMVLLRSCRHVAAWLDQGLGVDLSVNLSAAQLTHPRLVDDVAAALHETGFPAGSLWLEVTESALVGDLEQARESLHGLAAEGIRVAIDDFGTGWASLTYLDHFPVHALKIDRAFIDSSDTSERDADVLRSMVALGEDLHLGVIAKGVERERQAVVLREMGCPQAQGFLFGHPAPADQMLRHLLEEG